MTWRRVRLVFAELTNVEFVDRDRALRQIEELALEGTYPVYVIYGLEGCGKTALFRQAMEILRDHGYSIVYISPLEPRIENRLMVTEDLKDIAVSIIRTVAGEHLAEIVDAAIEIASWAIRKGRKRIAILADDIFQAADIDKAEIYVKTLLNLIEYPERI